MSLSRTHLDILCNYHDDYVAQSVEWLGSAGGYSGSMFWRVRGKKGTFCLRRWAKDYPDLERLEFIHAVLWHADQEGFRKLPVPVETLEHMSYVEEDGHFWQLEPWIPGKADFRHNSSLNRLVRAMTELAEFHNAVRSFPIAKECGITPVLQSHEAALLQWTDDFCDQLERRIRIQSQPLPELKSRDPRVLFISDLSDSDSFRRNEQRYIGNSVTISIPSRSNQEKRLEEVALRILNATRKMRSSLLAQVVRCSNYSMQFQPCIHDIHLGHTFFDGDLFTGFVDFGAMDVDNVSVDVARLLESLTAGDPALWVAGLTAYQSVRGLTLEERETVQVYRKTFAAVTAMRWLNYIFSQNNPVCCSLHLIQKLERLADELEAI